MFLFFIFFFALAFFEFVGVPFVYVVFLFLLLGRVFLSLFIYLFLDFVLLSCCSLGFLFGPLVLLTTKLKSAFMGFTVISDISYCTSLKTEKSKKSSSLQVNFRTQLPR